MRAIKKYLIPSLLVYSREEGKQKVAFVKRYYPHAWVHIDVMDGKFVPNTCWCTPQSYASLKIKNPQEIHLMVQHPETYIAKWKKAGARRIVFHYEATKKPLSVIQAIKKHELEAYIAINPGTPLKKIQLLLEEVDGILVMGVQPGWAGQSFKKIAIQKVRSIRKIAPSKPITVDGGVTFKNAEILLKSGATGLVSTTAVYGDRFKKPTKS